jgi:hypothetical protein
MTAHAPGRATAPAAVDADRALSALAALDGTPRVRIAELTSDGVRVTLRQGVVTPAEFPERASALRADALRALRAADVLGVA